MSNFDKKHKDLYSRGEVKQLREEFWKAFGQYMRAVPSVDGNRVSWLNYKTGIKHLYFRMDADKINARISIDIMHPDKGIRNLMYAQFTELKNIFLDIVGDDWVWEELSYRDDRAIATVRAELPNVNVFHKDDWPELISFFKPRIIALDEFWSLAKGHFEIFR